MMDQTNITVLNYSTREYPVQERFGMWVDKNHCDNRLTSDPDIAFDASASGAALGPFILSSRKWLNRGHKARYEMSRTRRQIRTDGQDFYRFTLLISGEFLSRTASDQPIKSRGDLFLLDAAQTNECLIEAGEAISLVVPRAMLPDSTAAAHGATITGGIGRLLADHLSSLFANLSRLRMADIDYVVRSTHQLLIASVSPTPDAIQVASAPIRAALVSRVQRYIDLHLLDPNLTPDRICRDVGVSRAKLYQLFEHQGGVMRKIQAMRLRLARDSLADRSLAHLRIAEIAWNHGFSNERYFHRLFKAEFGHTPRETPDQMSERGAPSGAWRLTLAKEHPESSGWTLPFGVPNT